MITSVSHRKTQACLNDSVAITSTSLVAGISLGISLVYATILTVLVVIQRNKLHAINRDEQELPDVVYEDVQDHASASETTQVNTKENIVYGQIMPQANN